MAALKSYCCIILFQAYCACWLVAPVPPCAGMSSANNHSKRRHSTTPARLARPSVVLVISRL